MAAVSAASRRTTETPTGEEDATAQKPTPTRSGWPERPKEERRKRPGTDGGTEGARRGRPTDGRRHSAGEGGAGPGRKKPSLENTKAPAQAQARAQAGASAGTGTGTRSEPRRVAGSTTPHSKAMKGIAEQPAEAWSGKGCGRTRSRQRRRGARTRGELQATWPPALRACPRGGQSLLGRKWGERGGREGRHAGAEKAPAESTGKHAGWRRASGHSQHHK